jgi:2-polyprenyl-3-methyl-5-hydroxy-6-metoxy-1,4-benzoquinol methylase
MTPGKALDCGCGAGGNACLLRGMRWRTTGVTISPSEADAASQCCDTVLLADLNSGIPQNAESPFDLVIFSHVLEHLLQPSRVLGDARRLLSAKGCILVALPNVLYWRQRIKFLAGKFDYEPTGIMDETHVRFYTFQSGKELLRSSGFEIVTATGDGDFPLPFFRRLLPGAAGKLDVYAGPLSPGLFSSQLLYVAKPTS